MDSEFSSSLDVVTRAIFNSTTDFCNPPPSTKVTSLGDSYASTLTSSSIQHRNVLLANQIRTTCQNHGWLAGWTSLFQLIPACGLHEQILNDVATCAEIYSRIRVSAPTTSPISVGMTVKSPPNIDSLKEIGPKGIGGKAWKVDPEYAGLRERWSSRGYAPMGPCTAFGWNGVNKKSVDKRDEESCRAMQMLGTVDYDFDLEDANDVGFTHSLEEAFRNVVKTGTAIQGSAVAALINCDLQRFVRSVQNEWVREAAGSYTLGPEDVSIDDFVRTNAIDCAAIMGLGYQDPSRHALSRKGIFIGNLLANMHDSLYDMGCSSRMSTVMYARGAGVPGHEIHRATAAVAVSCFDNMASRINNMADTYTLYYGHCMGIFAFSWSAFNGRYRTWERFVKYSRQLKKSESIEAKAVLKAAMQCLVLEMEDPDEDMAATWKRVLRPDAVEELTERRTQTYTPPAGHEILNTPGVPLPDICKPCNVSFRDVIHNTDDIVRGIEGLPRSATSCRALGLAAAIRRAAIFATTDDCCDVCACRIGNWGDSVAYRVLVTLMKSEEETSPKEWLLQHYIVACVGIWPVSVPSVLAGFDAVGDLRYVRGAMGVRDFVDC